MSRSGRPQIILHIGDGKCGSSSIQSSLLQAAPELERRRSMLYLTPRGRTSHFGLGTIIGKTTRGDDGAVHAGVTDALTKIRTKVERGGIDFVILSDESLFCIPPEQTIAILKGSLGSFGPIHVVSYLREPAGMYLSLMQQRLKADNIVTRPESYTREVDRCLCPWRDAAGVASVRVRPFIREALRNRSIISDFASILEEVSGQSDIQLIETEKNRSLTAEQIILLQMVQSTLFRDCRGKQTPEVKRLLKFFTSVNGLGVVGTSPKLQKRWEAVIQGNALEFFNRLTSCYPDTAGLLPVPVEVESSKLEPSDPRRIRTIIEPENKQIVSALRRTIPLLFKEKLGDFRREGLRGVEQLANLSDIPVDQVFAVARSFWRDTMLARRVS